MVEPTVNENKGESHALRMPVQRIHAWVAFFSGALVCGVLLTKYPAAVEFSLVNRMLALMCAAWVTLVASVCAWLLDQVMRRRPNPVRMAAVITICAACSMGVAYAMSVFLGEELFFLSTNDSDVFAIKLFAKLDKAMRAACFVLPALSLRAGRFGYLWVAVPCGLYALLQGTYFAILP